MQLRIPSGTSLLGALLVKSPPVAIFWMNELPALTTEEEGLSLHAQPSLLFPAYPTANKAGCCFTTALDTKPEASMPFLVLFTSFGHWSGPTLISGILLLLFLGVKRALEATHVPFTCEFETNFAKKCDTVS